MIPDRLVDPGKLVTWRPELLTKTSQPKSSNLYYRTVQPEIQRLVTWTPTIELNVKDRKHVARENIDETLKVKITEVAVDNSKGRYRSGLNPIPLYDVQPTSAYSTDLNESVNIFMKTTSPSEDKATSSDSVEVIIEADKESTNSTTSKTSVRNSERSTTESIISVVPLLNLRRTTATTRTASTTSTPSLKTASKSTSSVLKTTSSSPTPFHQQFTNLENYPANNFFKWLHDDNGSLSEMIIDNNTDIDPWNYDQDNYQSSSDQQQLQSSVLNWLASKSKLNTIPDSKKKSEIFIHNQPSEELDVIIENSSPSIHMNRIRNSPDKINYPDASLYDVHDEFEEPAFIVHTINGDVMEGWRDFMSESKEESVEHSTSDSNKRDLAESSLQVR